VFVFASTSYGFPLVLTHRVWLRKFLTFNLLSRQRIVHNPMMYVFRNTKASGIQQWSDLRSQSCLLILFFTSNASPKICFLQRRIRQLSIFQSSTSNIIYLCNFGILKLHSLIHTVETMDHGWYERWMKHNVMNIVNYAIKNNRIERW